MQMHYAPIIMLLQTPTKPSHQVTSTQRPHNQTPVNNNLVSKAHIYKSNSERIEYSHLLYTTTCMPNTTFQMQTSNLINLIETPNAHKLTNNTFCTNQPNVQSNKIYNTLTQYFKVPQCNHDTQQIITLTLIRNNSVYITNKCKSHNTPAILHHHQQVNLFNSQATKQSKQ
eukprot:gene3258-2240_t